MMNSDDSELAKKLIESEMLEILSVIGKAEDSPKRQQAIDAARTCLVKALDLGLIKPFTNTSWKAGDMETFLQPATKSLKEVCWNCLSFFFFFLHLFCIAAGWG